MLSRSRSESSVITLTGPEGRNVISDLTENEIQAFFQQVAGWHLVFQNVDARIGYNLPLPTEEFVEEDRGIDFLFSAFNPFTGRKEGILVETKHVKDKGTLYANRLQKYVETLKHKLDGIRASSQFQHDPDVQAHIDGAVDYGILILRFKQFDLEHFRRQCSQLDMSLHRGSGIPVIGILSNDRMSAFMELSRKADRKNLQFYYPRYLSNTEPRFASCLSLNLMFSDWILGAIESNGRNRTFILSFDEPEPAVFRLLSEVLQSFMDNTLFLKLDDLFFVRGDYESQRIYEQRLSNSPLAENDQLPKITTLRQDFNMSYNIAEELQWPNTAT